MAGRGDDPHLNDVKRRVIAAICMLYRWDFTLLEINANERSITHKLGEHLQYEFPKWHVDCEYNRLGVNTKQLELSFGKLDPEATEAITVFPDIIVHRRMTNSNLLIIEVKKAGGKLETEDLEKLKAFTREERFQYKYGLFLKLGANHAELDLYRNGCHSGVWTDDLRHALREFEYGD